MRPQNFFVCRPKFTKFLSLNVEGVVVDQVFFQLFDMLIRSGDICDQSCQKSCRNLDVFWPSQILGGGPSKSGTHIITPPSWHVVWKSFREGTPTSREVIGAHTLNFRPNFKFSRLNFFGGLPSPLWCALTNLSKFIARVKI